MVYAAPDSNAMGERWSTAESPRRNGTCPNLLSICSLDIMLYDPQSGTPVPFSNRPADSSTLGPYGSCWPSGPYTFVSPVPGQAANSWRGNTPNP
jgi:hypothetical protein